MSSYYNPVLKETVNIVTGVSKYPTYSGEKHNVIVACDLGRTITCFVDGVLTWSKETPNSWARALAVHQGLLFYADGRKFIIASPSNGIEYKSVTFNHPINSIKITQDNNYTFITICFDIQGIGSVEIYTWENFELTHIYSNPLPASNPRGAYYCAQWLFVADTFGHKVYAVDTHSNQLRIERDVYFPNSIEPIGPDKVLICAEHENRVYVWDYYPTTELQMELCAPVYPYNNFILPLNSIIELEGATADVNGKSLCAVEYAGKNTLYSPNSANKTDKGLLISDTDNHRVILIRDNKIIMEINGFNNPVNAVLF